MLKAENIFYTIGKKEILKGINAYLLPGEFNMILGPNGSGKSTFLKILSGETATTKGEVWYDEKKLKKIKSNELAKFRAVMSQQSELNFPLSIEEVVMMGRYPHFDFKPAAKDKTICDEAIKKLNLTDFQNRNYLTLSGGEKQRVQYARVLSQIWETPENSASRYLFLDEPLNNLDLNYQQQFLQIAKEFSCQNTTVIAVVHDINLAIQYGTNLIFMKEGKIVSSGKPENILSEKLIEDVFDVKVSITNDELSKRQLVVLRN